MKRFIFAIVGWFALNAPVSAGDRIDFDTQIIPVLTRHGCNAGACHGAAIGRGGFKLSLFGSGAAADQAAIAHELEGRRVHLADPQRSLLLRKATESVEHGGGERFQDDSVAYQLMLRWITEGARRTGSRQLVELNVTPEQVLLAAPGDEVSVSVQATFDDGQTIDVTPWIVLTSDDPASLEVLPDQARLVARRRGEHVVVARYLNEVRPIRVAIPINGQRPVIEPSATDNPIDQYVNEQLERLRLPPSRLSNDHEFARRVWLDLAGRLPTPDEVSAFVSQTSADKRETLIDRLLASDEFADYWALKWANILAIDSGQLQPQGAEAFHHWIADRLRRDAPWDEAALQMLTATGDGYAEGAVNFSRVGGGAEGLAEYASRVLMGVRLRCANCHNHPLDHWTQDDYHGLAAIFAKLDRGRFVSVAPRGEVTHPVTGQPAIPRIPGSHDLADDVDGREEFARWIADPNNPFLARATVNRLWRQLMSRGLIEPVDDLRDTNPATHPTLLHELTQQFVAGGFRFKPLIRAICLSDAYQRSGHTIPANRNDDRYYSHFIARPLEAEVVADAIASVTGVPIEFGDAAVSDAILLTDNRVDSIGLDVLGRCDRSLGCETGSAGAGSLARALHFLNGELLNEPISSPNCRLTDWLATEPDDLAVADGLYLRVLSRPMTVAERAYWGEQFGPAPETASVAKRRELFEDMLWSLLTSDAFLMNR